LKSGINLNTAVPLPESVFVVLNKAAQETGVNGCIVGGVPSGVICICRLQDEGINFSRINDLFRRCGAAKELSRITM
jgi:hypothetical protein